MKEKTRAVLEVFEEISRIPRCSKNEAAIESWLMRWAEDRGFQGKRDKAGNIVVRVPAASGYENRPPVVLQGHLDMVCQKTPDSNHDFTKDPIRIVYDGDWLTADRTTLGADNGIGLALGLALATDDDVERPPIELLFTVDEETGLTGANLLEPGFIEGRILLNLDSESEGVFIVGCAGGQHTEVTLPLSFLPLPENYDAWKLTAHGMRGGHSGIDIHKFRANAIKVLARALDAARRKAEIRILAVKGGSAHNAIARDAEAALVCAPSQSSALKDAVKVFEKAVQGEYVSTEQEMAVTLAEEGMSEKTSAFTKECTDIAIDLMLAIPHGVSEMSAKVEGHVETSNNFAIIETKNKELHILSSQRSSVMSRLSAITAQIEAAAALAGARAETGGGYPAWQPDMNSPLLKRCKEVYQRLFGKEPVVEVIHAGLECGIISSKYEGMDAISVGPTLENPHSPDERLYIPSVAKVWDFLVELLKSYGA
ncbi:MAG TPA: aminoacyl-histidine dipeptidase [Desulfatiglandales bacterium]|nr:aminoacyl-histidine dipeptidase [Desulfatiglandales bacterium]